MEIISDSKYTSKILFLYYFGNKNIAIEFTVCFSGIIFIWYAHNQMIGKSNNLEIINYCICICVTFDMAMNALFRFAMNKNNVALKWSVTRGFSTLLLHSQSKGWNDLSSLRQITLFFFKFISNVLKSTFFYSWDNFMTNFTHHSQQFHKLPCNELSK